MTNAKLLALAIIIASSTTAHAQSGETSASAASITADLVKNVEIAPTLGMASFGLAAQGEDYEQNAGFIVGAVAQGKIVENLRGQAGLVYFEAGGEKGNVDLNFSYLGVPVSALYYVTQLPAGTYVKGSVMPVYMIDAEQEVGTRTTSIGNKVNRWDVIPSIGVGYEVRSVGFNALMFELNYHYGLMDTLEGSKDQSEAYNRGVMLTGTVAL